MAKQTNKKDVENLIPFLDEAVDSACEKVSEASTERLFLNRIERTAREIYINSNKTTDVESAFQLAELFEFKAKERRNSQLTQYKGEEIIKNEFKNIICYPYDFNGIKNLLFKTKKKQSIRGRVFQNMERVTCILLGIGMRLLKFAKENKISISQIYQRPPENGFIENLTLEELQNEGSVFNKKNKKIPPLAFLFSIIVFLKYWKNFCKKID